MPAQVNNQYQTIPSDLLNSLWYIDRMCQTMPYLRALVNELLRLYKKCDEKPPLALRELASD